MMGVVDEDQSMSGAKDMGENISYHQLKDLLETKMVMMENCMRRKSSQSECFQLLPYRVKPKSMSIGSTTTLSAAGAECVCQRGCSMVCRFLLR